VEIGDPYSRAHAKEFIVLMKNSSKFATAMKITKTN